MESFNWQHGVFLTSSSETTAAAAYSRSAARSYGYAAVLRIQHGRLPGPLAESGSGPGKKMPKIFYVNWFRMKKDFCGQATERTAAC
jgi:GTP-dependent phosphoenolpyruvate carboxykinase